MSVWGKKLGASLAALSLIFGAVPATIGTANAVETGQLLDKGPRWPHKTSHYVTIVVGIAALVGLIFVLSNSDDKPDSP